MYGQVTCQHCQKQKAMFGDSFQKITYVECTKEAERCGKELK
jgi:ribosomal protein S27E